MLAVSGIASSQLESPDAGVSAVPIKLVKWEKMQMSMSGFFTLFFGLVRAITTSSKPGYK